MGQNQSTEGAIPGSAPGSGNVLEDLSELWPTAVASLATIFFLAFSPKVVGNFTSFFIIIGGVGFLVYTGTIASVLEVLSNMSLQEQLAHGAAVIAAHFFIGSQVYSLLGVDGWFKGKPKVLAMSKEQAQQEAKDNVTYPQTLPDDLKQAFDVCYISLAQELVNDLPSNYEMPQEVIDWISNMHDYNVKGGKLNRGRTVVEVHQRLAASTGVQKLSARELYRAAALGWCVEWLQAFFLVADDIMDDSETRRGQPCWYKKSDVKMIAINDSFLLESAVFRILKRHFGSEPYYAKLVDLFHEVIFQTELGQLLDLTSQPMTNDPHKHVVDLTRFTINRYQLIVKYKTAFYTFYLPLALGMITSGHGTASKLSLARNICCIIGEFFQIQDDYLDCFGDPKVTGKVGTDIQDNKCSWLVVQALSRADDKQKSILQNNYGQWNDSKVKKIKDLYVDMKLPELYKEYEEKTYTDVMKLIGDINDMPTEIFELAINKIYKRSK
uniref:Farnesyl diphosphate synthase n=1 Tax=Fibrocapsa japonica TaxID=94617 RepID=A0A7S2UU78_9STRA|mmetsp:Transcript_13583/g.19958  ORF Transcript_13583/g.19958 Transcript_13583/m.19958 type:complete len:496 (+) Transcript_13583:31-1518(+)|eukprot:CAMPEP_0113934860 /NCGR_PEP_ID=MMETSP1339-20121228/2114_1 /TAXON_ID=94617 /ORGANISM="Fibrocapsa japonica" /LENGTH=495 /DNA_ID=CAMNT_0000936811 /DNA_START=31 /DNA_END=1518 /DNA_ORIENTATION=+ /assembly_acc=CAM_ASM_000762